MWVRNGRALAPPCTGCSIGVSTSRKPRPPGTRARRARRRRAGRSIVAGVGVDDQVEVALPHPGLGVGQPAALVRQRAQALGGDRPVGGEHGQLAAAGGDRPRRSRRRGRRGRPGPPTGAARRGRAGRPSSMTCSRRVAVLAARRSTARRSRARARPGRPPRPARRWRCPAPRSAEPLADLREARGAGMADRVGLDARRRSSRS